MPSSQIRSRTRPSWTLLFGLGVAGGLLPDPGALAILLAAIASGKLVTGLCTVLVSSPQFDGLPLLEQHRLVNDALAAPLADGTIHELRIRTKGTQ